MEGHYICFCLTGLDKQWICCNDESVRPVSWQEVRLVEPYLLFYRAINFTVCSKWDIVSFDIILDELFNEREEEQ